MAAMKHGAQHRPGGNQGIVGGGAVAVVLFNAKTSSHFYGMPFCVAQTTGRFSAVKTPRCAILSTDFAPPILSDIAEVAIVNSTLAARRIKPCPRQPFIKLSTLVLSQQM